MTETRRAAETADGRALPQRSLVIPEPAPMTNEKAPFPKLSAHPAAAYLGSLAPLSRRTQTSALAALARRLGHADTLVCPWHELTYAHTTTLRADLAAAYAPATANRLLTALRRVLRECWRLGLMDREVAERASDLRPITSTTLPTGRALAAPELAALLAACEDTTDAGLRDAALIGLLYATGMRRSEAAALALADYAASSGALRIRHGKGDKARIVYAASARDVLAAYLAARGAEPGPLIVRSRRGGALTRERISDQAVADIVRKRATLAGIAHVTPHDLRRTCISDLLDAGADIATVQQLAGHADPATTARYDRRGERAKERAAGLLTLPHGRVS